MAIGAIIGGVAQIAGGIIGGAKARRAARAAKKKLRKMNAKMAQLEANRQEIINPYEGAQNLSDMMSNPMANLGVATQATEMQIEQTDQAGKSFVFNQTEQREMGQLNRLQGQIDNMQGIKAQASADQTRALTGAISGVASVAGSAFGDGS